MSKEELAALVAILNRVPVTPAEALWLQAIILRLQQQAEA